MGPLRPLSAMAGRHLLRWRTRLGRATAIHHLDLLAATITPMGYRCIKLYQADEFPTHPPVLWVFAFGPDRHVRVAVHVRAVPGGDWAYYEAGRGRYGYLCPCGDPKQVADQVDGLLRHRMFPSTW
ncbi:hypothetical protein E1264_22155 [Actinomadura sp. KC216]|uniref:hypothetical protein n=1 Tax=Actinomadura sp. KC216 TaxID=2530370 RepID=UPI001053DDC1|nr:hypothetical protein [Actinomadura sp. KC216]TDB85144.1 hypothetical protein E1264_22155 [Actinomadura sp. KC216]